MENERLHKARKIIWGSLSIFFLFCTYMGLLMLCFDGFEVAGCIVSGLCLFLCLFFMFMLLIENRYYKLKYYFLGKNFKKQVEESLSKFKNADEEFKKEFVKSRKPIYRSTGKIFYENDGLNLSAWLFKDDKNVKNFQNAYSALYNNITNKKGFVGFCKKIEGASFNSGWEVHSFFENDLTSNELRYLLNQVYILCDFCVSDNGLSENFTKQNNKNIKELDDVYSPILFGFKKEIGETLKKISGNKKPKTKKKSAKRTKVKQTTKTKTKK